MKRSEVYYINIIETQLERFKYINCGFNLHSIYLRRITTANITSVLLPR